MTKNILKTIALMLFVIALSYQSNSQSLSKIKVETDGKINVKSFTTTDKTELTAETQLPLVSFEVCLPKKLDQKEHYTTNNDNFNNNIAGGKIEVSYKPDDDFTVGTKGTVTFKNITKDTLWITNVVPFGTSGKDVYITGLGDSWLSRTHVFRTGGYEPVNCIVPDNAWELGYSGFALNEKLNVCALTRRVRESIKDGKRRRFETILYPNGEVSYNLYADTYEGAWQEGVRMLFQERFIYDVEPGTFNNSLFEREDLSWIRHCYLKQAMMGWDHNMYDITKSKYTLKDFIEFNNKVLGGAELYGLWPTWPALGMDNRNQWDMFRSMPGGLKKINELVKHCHENNSTLSIAFKPWDTATRDEDPYEGLAKVIKETEADVVVLDCSGASSEQLRKAADSGKKGVVMYSEGMAVPKDMQGIVSGRVHNALYYCPMLNLNKLIKPDFAIFRVVELGKERIRREYSLSLFNGYGTENNMYNPGRPYWLDEQWDYLAQILMIQRESSENFTNFGYTPLIPTLDDDIYVNEFPGKEKTIWTIYSLKPEGFFGELFKTDVKGNTHFVDLWNHEDVATETIDGKLIVKADVEAFSKKWLGTNNEGAVGAIARFPKLLKTKFNLPKDELTFSAEKGDKVRVWAGMPKYSGNYKDFTTQKQAIRLMQHFGRSEGKFVVQLFKNNILIDENVIIFKPASARLITFSEKTEPQKTTPKNMVKISSGKFTMEVGAGDNFIPYPEPIIKGEDQMGSFLMDKYPVTNKQFKIFIDAVNYQPTDTANYLKHWVNGEIPEGSENKPVTWVSYEDAQAYAKWTGKRLPTEREWQYAAQTSKLNEWPWGSNKGIEVEKIERTSTLTEVKIKGIDPKYANPGNGTLDDVGTHKKGKNPFGLEDLVGSVWQMTNDIYDNGSYSYIMVKGGCYYKAESSWWYVRGGPQNLKHRQMLLRVSQGFERKATVGFRCVADI